MGSNQRKLQKNWIYITMVMIVGFVAMTVFVAYSGFRSAEKTTEGFADFYLEENKARIKKEVESWYAAIAYEYRTEQIHQMNAVRHEVLHLTNLLEGQPIHGIKDIELRQKSVLAEVDRIVKNDEDFLYFVLDGDGNLLRSGTDSRFEGTNFVGVTDIDGVDMGVEFLKAKEAEDGIYITYSWPKVRDGEPYKKTTFAYYSEVYDIIIAAGAYHQDILDASRERMYTRLQNYNLDKKEYFFVTTYEGAIAQVAATPSGIGADYTAYEDYDGNPLHELFMTAAETEGGDFVVYRYYHADTDRLLEKISYVIGIEAWDAYIGLGFYNDDIKTVIDDYKNQYEAIHYREIMVIGLGMLLLALLILLFVKRGSRLLRVHLEHEEGMFTQLIQMVTEGVIIVDEEGRIRYTNKMVQSYFGDNVQDYLTGRQEHVKMLDKNTYRVDNGDRTYYVEVNEDYINYHNVPCKIHLIKNITAQYLKSNAFEQLSYIDELTELPNRRALANDYEAIKGQENEFKQCALGMIDLDHFKVINDSKGHDFGDEILKLLADVFVKRLRNTDKFYRYGGEEFIVLMKGTNLKSAKSLVEEINRAFGDRVKLIYGIDCTFSGGLVSVCHEEGVMNLKDSINEADRKLYQAKGEGRNRVVI